MSIPVIPTASYRSSRERNAAIRRLEEKAKHDGSDESGFASALHWSAVPTLASVFPLIIR